MAFTVVYPPERLTNFNLTVNSSQVLTQQFQLLNAGNVQANFTLPASSVLHGPTAVGQLGFTAVSNQNSAFVPLIISEIQGTKPNGTPVGNSFGQSGRVVVIGTQPLLEAWRGTNSQRMLTLFGNPGTSYEIFYNTNLLKTNWFLGWRLPQTNLAQSYAANQWLPQVYYRALEFSADPPIMELNSMSKTNVTLLLYGKNGTNYVIQATTNLSLTNGWFSTTNVTLTNSFNFIGNGNPTNQAMFFRAKRTL